MKLEEVITSVIASKVAKRVKLKSYMCEETIYIDYCVVNNMEEL